jgi:hypothetical protein
VRCGLPEVAIVLLGVGVRTEREIVVERFPDVAEFQHRWRTDKKLLFRGLRIGDSRGVSELSILRTDPFTLPSIPGQRRQQQGGEEGEGGFHG